MEVLEKQDDSVAYAIETADDKSLFYEMNKTIKRVTDCMEGGRFGFNTAISSIMELVNEMYRYKDGAQVNYTLMKEVCKNLVLVLSPFAPHICEEMWSRFGIGEKCAYFEQWPAYDEKALVLDTVEIVVQLNGKVKMKADVANGLTREALAELMLADERVKELIEGKNVVKVIAVPGKLVNIVVK